jgi:hypothetical protein
MSLSGTGHQLSGRRIWSGSPLKAIAGTLISSIAVVFLNVQVRVYDQPENPSSSASRRAPVLFARADEIIE